MLIWLLVRNLIIYVEKFKAIFEVITRWRDIKCLPRLIRE